MKYLLQIILLFITTLPFSTHATWGDWDMCNILTSHCEEPKHLSVTEASVAETSVTEISICDLLPSKCDMPKPPIAEPDCKWGSTNDSCKEPPCEFTEDCKPSLSIPEPAVFGLLAVGLAGLGVSRRMK